MEPTYKIVRFRQNGPSEVISTGVTLEEAQAHCNREDTKGDGWFDGYEQEAVIVTVNRLILDEDGLFIREGEEEASLFVRADGTSLLRYEDGSQEVNDEEVTMGLLDMDYDG